MNLTTITILAPLVAAVVQAAKALSARTGAVPTIRDLGALVLTVVAGFALAGAAALAGVGSLDSLPDVAGTGTVASALASLFYTAYRLMERALVSWAGDADLTMDGDA